MPEELAVVLIVAAAVVGMLLLLFWVLPWLIERGDPGFPSVEGKPTDRIESDCHPAPVVPFTVAQARIVMQKLIRCDADRCDCKAAAFRVLVEAGLVRPAKALR